MIVIGAMGAALSLSMIDAVAEAVPIVALIAPLKLSVKFSSTSAVTSLIRTTRTILDNSPGANVKLAEVPT